MGRRFVMVPGIGGSGPEHWQSHWETLYPNTLRIEPNSWDEPDLADWFAALDRAVASAPYPPVLVCHSLGCLLFAHWRAASSRRSPRHFLLPCRTRAGRLFRRRQRHSERYLQRGLVSGRCWPSQVRTIPMIRRRVR